MDAAAEVVAALSLDGDNARTGTAAERPGVAKLHSWMNRLVRVRLTDGRMVTGTLRCLDRDRNLVLASAVERYGGKRFRRRPRAADAPLLTLRPRLRPTSLLRLQS